MVYILPANIVVLIIIFALIKRYYEKMTKEKFQELYPEIRLSDITRNVKIIEHTYKWQPFRGEFKINKSGVHIYDERFDNGLDPRMPQEQQFEIMKTKIAENFVDIILKGNFIRIEKDERMSNRNQDHFDCELIIARPPENTTEKLIN